MGSAGGRPVVPLQKEEVVTGEKGAAANVDRWRLVMWFGATLAALFLTALIAGAQSIFGSAGGVSSSFSLVRADGALAVSVANMLAPGTVSIERHDTGSCPGPFSSQTKRSIGPLEPTARTHCDRLDGPFATSDRSDRCNAAMFSESGSPATPPLSAIRVDHGDEHGANGRPRPSVGHRCRSVAAPAQRQRRRRPFADAHHERPGPGEAPTSSFVPSAPRRARNQTLTQIPTVVTSVAPP